MLRGINKNVIEIVDTGNEYFERAILFVRNPEQQDDREKLSQSARRYLSGLRLRPKMLGGGNLGVVILKYGSAVLLGAGATAFLINLL